MKLLFLTLMISGACFGQTDSARLKVTRARSSQDRTYYWLKNLETKENYYTVCSCVQKHFKGDIVLIAKKDIEFVDDGKPVTFDKPFKN